MGITNKSIGEEEVMKNQDLLKTIDLELRKRDISQTALAERMGVTNQSVCKWLNGSRVPTFKHLLVMLDVIEMDIELVPRKQQ